MTAEQLDRCLAVALEEVDPVLRDSYERVILRFIMALRTAFLVEAKRNN